MQISISMKIKGQQDYLIVDDLSEPKEGHIAVGVLDDGVYMRKYGHGSEKIGSGGGGACLEIPKLKLDSGYYREYPSARRDYDSLYAKWESENREFLNYNPEIWTFRPRIFMKKKFLSERVSEINLMPTYWNQIYPPLTWELSELVSFVDGELALQFDDCTVDDYARFNWRTDLAINKEAIISFELASGIGGTSIFSGGVRVGTNIVDGVPQEYSEEFTTQGVHTFRFRNRKFTTPKYLFKFEATANPTNLVIRNITLHPILKQFNIKSHNKWNHEPHLNGVKYPGGNYYAGGTASLVPGIAETGRHTEFALTAQSGEFQPVNLDVWEYVYGMSGNLYAPNYYTPVRLTSGFDYQAASVMKINIAGCKKNRAKRAAFRFAIVIDNPDYPETSGIPKLIGPLSDLMFLVTSYLGPEYKGYVKFNKVHLRVH